MGVALAMAGMKGGGLVTSGFPGFLGPPPPPVGGDGSNVYTTVTLNDMGASSKVVNTYVLNI